MRQADLKTSIQAILKARQPPISQAEPHATPEELAAYQQNALEESERDRVRRHLIACRECTRALLDLADFPEIEPLEVQQRMTDQDVDARWKRLRERMRKEAPELIAKKSPSTELEPDKASPAPLLQEANVSNYASRSPRESFIAFTTSVRFYRAAAAIFFSTTIGLGALLISSPYPEGSSNRLAVTSPQPVVNVPILELAPIEDLGERTLDRYEKVFLEGTTLLVFATIDVQQFEHYEIQVMSADSNKILWRNSNLKRMAPGYFTVEVTRQLLPAGRYFFKIRGWREGEPEEVATYLLDVSHSPVR